MIHVYDRSSSRSSATFTIARAVDRPPRLRSLEQSTVRHVYDRSSSRSSTTFTITRAVDCPPARAVDRPPRSRSLAQPIVCFQHQHHAKQLEKHTCYNYLLSKFFATSNGQILGIGSIGSKSADTNTLKWARSPTLPKLPDSPDRIIFHRKVGQLDILFLCMFCLN